MTFLVDAQLPPGLALFLREQGYAARHVVELGLGGATDTIIWERARHDGDAIITKDEDFAIRSQFDASGPPVVWLRIGNATNRSLLRWLSPLLPEIADRIDQGEKLIEII